MTVKELLNYTSCLKIEIEDEYTKEILRPSIQMIAENDFSDFNNRIVKHYYPFIDYTIDKNLKMKQKTYLRIVCETVPFDPPYTT